MFSCNIPQTYFSPPKNHPGKKTNKLEKGRGKAKGKPQGISQNSFIPNQINQINQTDQMNLLNSIQRISDRINPLSKIRKCITQIFNLKLFIIV